jgi:peptide/nickel transport system permease protein
MPVMLLISVFIIFCLINLSPADPAIYLLPTNHTQEQTDELHHKLGLDQPIIVQYANWVWNAVHGDFGTSWKTQQPVWTEIVPRIPVTVKLSLFSTLLIVAVGTPLGILCAVKQYSLFDTITNAISKILGSFPGFWLSLMLILIFSCKLHLLPTYGLKTLSSWILPLLSLSLPYIAMFLRIARSSMLDCVRQDYVRTARSKGAKERSVIFRDALRNALLPLVTMTGMQFAMMMGGTLIVENIFAIPGLGAKIVDAVNQKDIPMILACTVVLAIFFMVVTLLIDLTYTLIDPRIKGSFVTSKKARIKKVKELKEAA